MKKLFSVFVLLVMSLLLVACGPKEVTATGYGITHKIYVGVITLTVDKDGVVLDGEVDEYYLPYNAAVVTVTDPENLPDDVIVGVSHGTKYFAKYFSINGKLFVGTGSETGLPTYSYNGTDLLEWVAIEENAKAYVEGCDAGTVFVANAAGTKHATYATPNPDNNGKNEWKKSDTNYGGTNWNWAEQVAWFIDTIKGTKMNDTFSRITDEGADKGKWVAGDIVSSATMVDFPQYYAVAVRAYNTATK